MITDDEIVALALSIATEAHRGQTRRNGEPYIQHPERVAGLFTSAENKAIAWLHDVLEDTAITAVDLRERGVPDLVIHHVMVLTKEEGESYPHFIARVALHPRAVRIKLADILDNLGDAPSEKQVRKYAGALARLLFGEGRK